VRSAIAVVLLTLAGCPGDEQRAGGPPSTKASSTSTSTTSTTAPFRPRVSQGRLTPVPVLFGDAVLVADAPGTFADVTPAHGETEFVYDVFFSDRQHGWVGFTDFDRASGRLVRTLDGGRTWEPTDLTARVHQSAGSRVWLYFLGTGHGWAVQSAAAGGAGIRRSADGGRTWSEYKDLEETRGPVRFQTPRHGWLASWSSPGSWHGLFESFDGGDTWRQRSVDPPEGAAPDTLAYRLPSFYGSRGVLPVAIPDERVAFYASSDEGRRWRLVTTVPVPGSGRAGIAVASAQVWWVIAGDGGAVMVTEDAGRTWASRRRAGLPEVVDDVEAENGRRALASAFNRDRSLGIYETTDGGETWHPLGPNGS
jgi:photosystem II stability/assembly factor-like uncharacterized protein